MRKSILRPMGSSESSMPRSCDTWRAQAHGLLVHGDLVGVDGGLGQDARFVDRRALQDLLHARGQLLAVLAHRFGRALLDLAGERFDGREPAADVLGQLAAFRRAHLVIGLRALRRAPRRCLHRGIQDPLRLSLRSARPECGRSPSRRIWRSRCLPPSSAQSLSNAAR